MNPNPPGENTPVRRPPERVKEMVRLTPLVSIDLVVRAVTG